jgi:hypothetical protein
MHESNWRAPWFETIIPLHPTCCACFASSAVSTPLTSTGKRVLLQRDDYYIFHCVTYRHNQATSFHVNDGSIILRTYDAKPDDWLSGDTWRDISRLDAKFAMLTKCIVVNINNCTNLKYVGNVNALRSSSRRLPASGVSIVNTSAV